MRSARPGRRWVSLLCALPVLAGVSACRQDRSTVPAARAARLESPPEFRFVDATQAAGLKFRHTHGGSGRKYLPETVGSGVAWLDYDGDGWQDLLFVNCKPMPGTPPGDRRSTAALYRNRGDGTFEERTRGSGLDVPLYGQGVTAADYDGDGDPDVLITCLGPNHLFRNEGDGSFSDVTRQAGLSEPDPWRYHGGSAWLDYDRDGWLDLFVSRYIRWTPETDPFCGIAGKVKRYCPPWTAPRERSSLYRNLGDGRFEDVSRKMGVSELEGYWFQPIALDYDGDSWPDVAVICDGTPMALYRNEGGKRFTDAAPELGLSVSEDGTPKSQMGIDIADWRNCGREAVLVGNFAGERLSLFETPEPESYSDAVDRVGMGKSSLHSLTFGVAFLDVDLDGWQDAFIGNGHIDDYIERFDANVTYAQLPLLYRNRRGERFDEVGARSGPAFTQKLVARGCAVADYDRDGDPDLVVTENNRPARLFRNDTRTENRALRIVLQGKSNNRAAIGARVDVTAAGMRQQRWVRAGGHFYSQSELPLLFGVGAAARVDVAVSWPSGRKTERRGVPANTTLTLSEE